MGLPRIGYDNLLRATASTVTGSVETTGYEAANVHDWHPFSRWKADSGGLRYLTVDLGSAQAVNSWGLYGHNLGAIGGSIALQYSDGDSSWTNYGTQQSPTGTECIFITGTSSSHRYWRWQVNPGSGDAYIGVLFLGPYLELQRGCQAGFAPPPLAWDDRVTNSRSVTGGFLGRSIVKQGIVADVSLNDMTEAWALASLEPFLSHGRRYPFFMQWEPENLATQVGFFEFSNAVPRATYSRNGFLSVSLSLHGAKE